MGQVSKKTFSQLAAQVDQLLKQVENYGRLIQSLDMTLLGVVEMLGRDDVNAAAAKYIEDQRVAHEASQAVYVSDRIARGELVVTDVVAPDSFVVFRQVFQDGSSARAQAYYTGLSPEASRLFLGKKVGDTVQLGAVRAEVLEVYRVVPPKPAEQAVAIPQEAPAESSVPGGTSEPTRAGLRLVE